MGDTEWHHGLPQRHFTAPESRHSLFLWSSKRHSLCQLCGARLGEGVHAALAGRVLAAPRRTSLALDAGHVDDGAAAIPDAWLFQQRPRECLTH